MANFKKIFISTVLVGAASSVLAALPPQFSECIRADTSSMASVSDLRDMAKVSKVTYCQNQVTLVGAADVKELLKSNVDVGISLARTSYSYDQLLDMASSGSYLLYVDATKLSVAQLTALAQQGVQLAIMSSTSGLSQSDLVNLGNTKSFIYNVMSTVPRADLQALVNLGVQVVIRTAQSGMTKDDIVAVAQTNSSLVTVYP